MWLMGSRHWEIVEDWRFEVNGQKHVIPAGFQFDGASVPKFLATFLSPVGVLLMGGLVHDYIYKYATLLKDTKKRPNCGVMTQKEAEDGLLQINAYNVSDDQCLLWHRLMNVNGVCDICSVKKRVMRE